MEQCKDCKNILCIRLDNIGDVIMSEPAMRALKETFHCRLTILTSSSARQICGSISAVDEVLVYDVPWVKSKHHSFDLKTFVLLIEQIKQKQFDAAVIFSVFSQNPLPSAMIAYMAGIPQRLAYCRENPYALLTHWIPDQEPYIFVQHQVKRDLMLVESVGANIIDDHIKLVISSESSNSSIKKLIATGIDLNKPWIIFHPGVSEEKRMYPKEHWSTAGKDIVQRFGIQVLITGSESEISMADDIKREIGEGAYSVAGKITLNEFIALIGNTSLLVSVNTSAVHIASATRTRVIVLYAMTNPQHAPWKSFGKILKYSIKKEFTSKNEILRYVSETYFGTDVIEVLPSQIVTAVEEILVNNAVTQIPELVYNEKVIVTKEAVAI